jgi:hypothetical protein
VRAGQEAGGGKATENKVPLRCPLVRFFEKERAEASYFEEHF